MRDLLAACAAAFLADAVLPLVLWTALTLAAEAALRIGRAHAALSLPLRSALLAALPVALVAGPLARWLTPATVVVSAPLGRIREAVLTEVVVGAAPGLAPSGPPDALVWLGALLALAALVAVVALVRLAVALVRLQRLDLPDAPADVQARAADALRGVHRDVRVVAGGDVPMTFGLWRPVLVVPDGLTGDALDLALAHEAAHLRAADFGWHLASRAVAAVFAAHPLVHVLVRGQSLDRERLADAAVLAARPRARRAYAELLVSFSSCPTPRLALGVAAPPLLHRLTAMTRPQLPHHVRRSQRLGRTAGLGALTFVVGLAVVTASPSAASQAQTNRSNNQLSIEWMQPDAVPSVVVTLPNGSDRAAALRVADEWTDPAATGTLTVRYDGGQIQRTGVRADRLPPTPPPPPTPPRRRRPSTAAEVPPVPDVSSNQGAAAASDPLTDLESYAASIDLPRFVKTPEVQSTLRDLQARMDQHRPRSARGVVRHAGVDLSRLANSAQIQAMIDALPARLDAEGVSYGDVRVEYLIDPDGTTRRFRVLTGPRDLHDAAVSVARALRLADDALPGAPVEGFFRLWYTAG